jgi:16S rRNA (uracil1498-N3)-methyltransferase
MTLHRFLVPALIDKALVDLPETESHHASRVLRCSVGESIVLFDGLGNEAIGTIVSLDKRSVSASIESVQFAPRDHMGRLHFAVAMPKGDRQRNTIEKLVELGVDSFSPLSSSRSVAIVDDSKIDKLDRYILEACKQCRRNRLMAIRTSLQINSIHAFQPKSCVWMLHPKQEYGEACSIQEANRLALDSTPTSILFLVGPEGGFTDIEVNSAIAQGARILSLGDRIQRVETAVATAAVLGSCWLENSSV